MKGPGLENLRRTKQFAFANAISHFTSYKLHHHSRENAPDTIHWPLPRLYRWRRRAWNFMIYESAPICPSTLSSFSTSLGHQFRLGVAFFAFKPKLLHFFHPNAGSFGQKGSGHLINEFFTFSLRNYEHWYCARAHITYTLSFNPSGGKQIDATSRVIKDFQMTCRGQIKVQ